jgi:DNA polymerase-3 subunit alpha
MSDDRRPRLSVDNCLKSRAEMTALFADIPDRKHLPRFAERRAPILPRFTGGGPEAALAAEAAELRRQAREGLDRGSSASGWPRAIREAITTSG